MSMYNMSTVISDDNRVLGYCVVPMTENDKNVLPTNYGERYTGAKYWLVVLNVVDHGGEGLDEDMEETITVWPMDEHYALYDDSSFEEYDGGHREFTKCIDNLLSEGLL